MDTENSRAGQLNAVVDPQLIFLAKLAARYKQQPLNRFIENALREALREDAIEPDDDPTEFVSEPKPLWREGLLNESKASRLYLVGIEPCEDGRDLLSPKQRSLFENTVRALMRQGKKRSHRNFVELLEQTTNA